jgi:hypothetical protein
VSAFFLSFPRIAAAPGILSIFAPPFSLEL